MPNQHSLLVDNVLDLVGRTPLVKLARLSPAGGALVVGKLEAKNPGGSVKDRPALAMIDAAEKSGALTKGATIVEATSGNTGVSLAMIAAVRGYPCVIVIPDDVSRERRALLRAYGARVVLTPADQGMIGAVERAQEILRETENAFMPRQFENHANVDAHEHTTAREILDALGPELVAFVAGVGTGGTLTGVARVLKRERPQVAIVAVEPKNSAVLSGGPPGLHGIQGLGAGFVPKILERQLIDRVIAVADVAAEESVRRLAREEGLLVGPSSGANVHAAIEIAKSHTTGIVATVLCDTGERYLF